MLCILVYINIYINATKMAAESRGGLSGSTPLCSFRLQYLFRLAFFAVLTPNFSVQDAGLKDNQVNSQPRVHSRNNQDPAPNNFYGGYGCTWLLCLWVLAPFLGFLQVCTTAQLPSTSQQRRGDKKTAYPWLLLCSWLLFVPLSQCIISNELSTGTFPEAKLHMLDTSKLNFSGHGYLIIYALFWQKDHHLYGCNKIKQQHIKGKYKRYVLYFFLNSCCY